MILERDDYIEIVMEWLGGGKKKKTEHHDEPKAPVVSSARQMKIKRESIEQNLIDAFDEVDEDGTEFAPRLDLRKAVEKHVPQCAEAQKLADYIRQLDVMIIEKEDYEGFVEQWVEGTLHH